MKINEARCEFNEKLFLNGFDGAMTDFSFYHYNPIQITLEMLCDQVEGNYNTTLDFCIKRMGDSSSSDRLKWSDAFRKCIADAPSGTKGRLVHVTSEDKWNIVKDYSDYWIGLKTYDLTNNTIWDPDEWDWYDETYTDGATVAAGYYPQNIIMDGHEGEKSCMRSKSEAYKTQECSSEERFLCEFYIETRVQLDCSSISGRYSSGLDICFKKYSTDYKTNWTSAFENCQDVATSGTKGQLVHVTTEQKWEIVKQYHDYWIGAKSTDVTCSECGIGSDNECIGCEWNPAKWNWYDSSNTAGDSLTGGYYPESPIVENTDDGLSCFRVKYQNYKTEYCDKSEKYLCELIEN